MISARVTLRGPLSFTDTYGAKWKKGQTETVVGDEKVAYFKQQTEFEVVVRAAKVVVEAAADPPPPTPPAPAPKQAKAQEPPAAAKPDVAREEPKEPVQPGAGKPAGPPPDYHKMRRADLDALAESRGLEPDDYANKAQVIAALEAQDEGADDDGAEDDDDRDPDEDGDDFDDDDPDGGLDDNDA